MRRGFILTLILLVIFLALATLGAYVFYRSKKSGKLIQRIQSTPNITEISNKMAGLDMLHINGEIKKTLTFESNGKNSASDLVIKFDQYADLRDLKSPKA